MNVCRPTRAASFNGIGICRAGTVANEFPNCAYEFIMSMWFQWSQGIWFSKCDKWIFINWFGHMQFGRLNVQTFLLERTWGTCINIWTAITNFNMYFPNKLPPTTTANERWNEVEKIESFPIIILQLAFTQSLLNALRLRQTFADGDCW